MSNEKIIELKNNAGSGDFTAAETGVAVNMITSPFIARNDAKLHILGVFVGTMIVEGSDDNVTYSTLVTATAPELKQVSLKAYMRARCSAYTSGTIKVRLSN